MAESLMIPKWERMTIDEFHNLFAANVFSIQRKRLFHGEQGKDLDEVILKYVANKGESQVHKLIRHYYTVD